MLSMSERLATLNTMKTLGISVSLTGTHTQKQLQMGCLAMQSHALLDAHVRNCPTIQRTLIARPDFSALYSSLLNRGLTPDFVESWLHESDESKCCLWDYTPDEICQVAQLPDLCVRAKQEYLLYYVPMQLTAKQAELLLRSIAHFYAGSHTTLTELTDTQRRLLLQPFFCDFLFSHELADTLPLLDKSPALVHLLNVLCLAKVQYVFTKADLTLLQNVRDSDCKLLEQLHYALGDDPERTAHLIHLWLDNQAPMLDLPLLLKKIPELTADEIDTMLSSQLAYLNTLHAGAIGAVPFSEVPDYMLPLLVHAIAKRQNTFLRLFTEHYQDFVQLDPWCMLFEEAFYTRIILNTLTAQNLRRLRNSNRSSLMLDNLNDRIYTFAELDLLAYAPLQYLHICNLLTALRTDQRLIVLRQLIKREAVPAAITDAQLHELTSRLCIKPLSEWKNAEFAHLPAITYPQCAAFLSSYSTLGKYLPQMQTADEAEFATRNADALAGYDTWQDVQAHLGDIDATWQELSQKLELDDAFITQHTPTILRFLARNGAAIAMDYVTCQKKPEGFFRILRAELMGQLPLLKYHQDDLNRELDFVISDSCKAAWKNCKEATSGCFHIAEKDDFITTMRIGELPTRTCLHYQRGSQRKCLLSCFDANKKLLMAYRHGRPVARAIIRLTKANPQGKSKTDSLEFADLLNPSEPAETPKEHLVIFLERMYQEGISEQDVDQIRHAFIALVEEKAAELNALPYLSSNYSTAIGDLNYAAAPAHLYISKSKAGSQYLDSLGGENGPSDEGDYHRCCLLMPGLG